MSFSRKQNAVISGCTGKPRYPTYSEANEHARRGHGHAKLNPYHCTNCGAFHIGNRHIKKLARPRPILIDDDELAYGIG